MIMLVHKKIAVNNQLYSPKFKFPKNTSNAKTCLQSGCGGVNNVLVENISLKIGLYRNYSAQPVITDQAVITGIFFTIKNPCRN